MELGDWTPGDTVNTLVKIWSGVMDNRFEYGCCMKVDEMRSLDEFRASRKDIRTWDISVAYLGFQKGGAKFSLATSAHLVLTQRGGAKPSFPIF